MTRSMVMINLEQVGQGLLPMLRELYHYGRDARDQDQWFAAMLSVFLYLDQLTGQLRADLATELTREGLDIDELLHRTPPGVVLNIRAFLKTQVFPRTQGEPEFSFQQVGIGTA